MTTENPVRKETEIKLSRRRFLEYATSLSAVALGSSYTIFNQGSKELMESSPIAGTEVPPVPPAPKIIVPPEVTPEPIIADVSQAVEKAERQRMLEKVQRFDEDLEGDIWLNEKDWLLLQSVHSKIARVKNYVGYGHFNILSFDEMLKYLSLIHISEPTD